MFESWPGWAGKLTAVVLRRSTLANEIDHIDNAPKNTRDLGGCLRVKTDRETERQTELVPQNTLRHNQVSVGSTLKGCDGLLAFSLSAL